MRSSLLMAAALLAVAGTAGAAAPVADALQRPALVVKAPERAVLLSAARAGDRLVAVGERGIVALSDDQGASWRQAPCPVSVTLTMVRFADARHGVAVGHGGTVLTTADAGASWTPRLDGRQIARLAERAARTPEAQREAARLLVDGPDKPLLDVLLWDARQLLVVGAYGLALHSADGGQSWTPWMDRLPNPKGLHWYLARRQGSTLVLAGEQGLLLRSDDEGRHFRPLASPYAGSWFAGEFESDGALVLAGLRGNVWRSPDAAGRWAPLSAPVPATITAMARAADGGLLLASQAGLLLKLQGDALRPVHPTPVPMPAALLPLRDGRLLALGVAGVTPVTPTASENRP